MQLGAELKILLTNFGRACLPVAKLHEAYRTQFGKDLVVTDYGFESLVDLLKASSTVHLMGKEPNLVITLTHDTQVKQFEKLCF